MRSACVALLLLASASSACEETRRGDAPAPAALASVSAPLVSAAPSASAAPAPMPVAEVAPTSIAAQHVLVAFKGAKDAPKGVTRSKADAKKRADEVVAKVGSGSDFSSLVAEYSDDPSAKERMGSLGKFTRDKMVPAFSDAAFKLRVGEASGTVETAYGFHVIKRNQ